jgi:hypothetical protein
VFPALTKEARLAFGGLNIMGKDKPDKSLSPSNRSDLVGLVAPKPKAITAE